MKRVLYLLCKRGPGAPIALTMYDACRSRMEVKDVEEEKSRRMQPVKLQAALITTAARKPLGRSRRNAIGKENKRKKMDP